MRHFKKVSQTNFSTLPDNNRIGINYINIYILYIYTHILNSRESCSEKKKISMSEFRVVPTLPRLPESRGRSRWQV